MFVVQMENLLHYSRIGRTDKIIEALSSGELGREEATQIAIVAAKHGHSSIIDILIDSMTIDYERVAISAAKRGRDNIVDVLIRIGGLEDMSSIVAGYAYGGYREIILRYVDNDIDLNLIAYTAAKRGYSSIITDMIDEGASDYDYIAYGAIEEGRLDIIMDMISLVDMDVLHLRDVAQIHRRNDITAYIDSTIIYDVSSGDITHLEG